MDEIYDLEEMHEKDFIVEEEREIEETIRDIEEEVRHQEEDEEGRHQEEEGEVRHRDEEQLDSESVNVTVNSVPVVPDPGNPSGIQFVQDDGFHLAHNAVRPIRSVSPEEKSTSNFDRIESIPPDVESYVNPIGKSIEDAERDAEADRRASGSVADKVLGIEFEDGRELFQANENPFAMQRGSITSAQGRESLRGVPRSSQTSLTQFTTEGSLKARKSNVTMDPNQMAKMKDPRSGVGSTLDTPHGQDGVGHTLMVERRPSLPVSSVTSSSTEKRLSRSSRRSSGDLAHNALSQSLRARSVAEKEMYDQYMQTVGKFQHKTAEISGAIMQSTNKMRSAYEQQASELEKLLIAGDTLDANTQDPNFQEGPKLVAQQMSASKVDHGLKRLSRAGSRSSMLGSGRHSEVHSLNNTEREALDGEGGRTGGAETTGSRTPVDTISPGPAEPLSERGAGSRDSISDEELVSKIDSRASFSQSMSEASELSYHAFSGPLGENEKSQVKSIGSVDSEAGGFSPATSPFTLTTQAKSISRKSFSGESGPLSGTNISAKKTSSRKKTKMKKTAKHFYASDTRGSLDSIAGANEIVPSQTNTGATNGHDSRMGSSDVSPSQAATGDGLTIPDQRKIPDERGNPLPGLADSMHLASAGNNETPIGRSESGDFSQIITKKKTDFERPNTLGTGENKDWESALSSKTIGAARKIRATTGNATMKKQTSDGNTKKPMASRNLASASAKPNDFADFTSNLSFMASATPGKVGRQRKLSIETEELAPADSAVKSTKNSKKKILSSPSGGSSKNLTASLTPSVSNRMGRAGGGIPWDDELIGQNAITVKPPTSPGSRFPDSTPLIGEDVFTASQPLTSGQPLNQLSVSSPAADSTWFAIPKAKSRITFSSSAFLHKKQSQAGEEQLLQRSSLSSTTPESATLVHGGKWRPSTMPKGRSTAMPALRGTVDAITRKSIRKVAPKGQESRQDPAGNTVGTTKEKSGLTVMMEKTEADHSLGEQEKRALFDEVFGKFGALDDPSAASKSKWNSVVNKMRTVNRFQALTKKSRTPRASEFSSPASIPGEAKVESARKSLRVRKTPANMGEAGQDGSIARQGSKSQDTTVETVPIVRPPEPLSSLCEKAIVFCRSRGIDSLGKIFPAVEKPDNFSGLDASLEGVEETIIGMDRAASKVAEEYEREISERTSKIVSPAESRQPVSKASARSEDRFEHEVDNILEHLDNMFPKRICGCVADLSSDPADFTGIELSFPDFSSVPGSVPVYVPDLSSNLSTPRPINPLVPIEISIATPRASSAGSAGALPILETAFPTVELLPHDSFAAIDDDIEKALCEKDPTTPRHLFCTASPESASPADTHINPIMETGTSQHGNITADEIKTAIAPHLTLVPAAEKTLSNACTSTPSGAASSSMERKSLGDRGKEQVFESGHKLKQNCHPATMIEVERLNADLPAQSGLAGSIGDSSQTGGAHVAGHTFTNVTKHYPHKVATTAYEDGRNHLHTVVTTPFEDKVNGILRDLAIDGFDLWFAEFGRRDLNEPDSSLNVTKLKATLSKTPVQETDVQETDVQKADPIPPAAVPVVDVSPMVGAPLIENTAPGIKVDENISKIAMIEKDVWNVTTFGAVVPEAEKDEFQAYDSVSGPSLLQELLRGETESSFEGQEDEISSQSTTKSKLKSSGKATITMKKGKSEAKKDSRASLSSFNIVKSVDSAKKSRKKSVMKDSKLGVKRDDGRKSVNVEGDSRNSVESDQDTRNSVKKYDTRKSVKKDSKKIAKKYSKVEGRDSIVETAATADGSGDAVDAHTSIKPSSDMESPLASREMEQKVSLAVFTLSEELEHELAEPTEKGEGHPTGVEGEKSPFVHVPVIHSNAEDDTQRYADIGRPLALTAPHGISLTMTALLKEADDREVGDSTIEPVAEVETPKTTLTTAKVKASVASTKTSTGVKAVGTKKTATPKKVVGGPAKKAAGNASGEAKGAVAKTAGTKGEAKAKSKARVKTIASKTKTVTKAKTGASVVGKASGKRESDNLSVKTQSKTDRKTTESDGGETTEVDEVEERKPAGTTESKEISLEVALPKMDVPNNLASSMGGQSSMFQTIVNVMEQKKVTKNFGATSSMATYSFAKAPPMPSVDVGSSAFDRVSPPGPTVSRRSPFTGSMQFGGQFGALGALAAPSRTGVWSNSSNIPSIVKGFASRISRKLVEGGPSEDVQKDLQEEMRSKIARMSKPNGFFGNSAEDTDEDATNVDDVGEGSNTNEKMKKMVARARAIHRASSDFMDKNAIANVMWQDEECRSMLEDVVTQNLSKRATQFKELQVIHDSLEVVRHDFADDGEADAALFASQGDFAAICNRNLMELNSPDTQKIHRENTIEYGSEEFEKRGSVSGWGDIDLDVKGLFKDLDGIKVKPLTIMGKRIYSLILSIYRFTTVTETKDYEGSDSEGEGTSRLEKKWSGVSEGDSISRGTSPTVGLGRPSTSASLGRPSEVASEAGFYESSAARNAEVVGDVEFDARGSLTSSVSSKSLALKRSRSSLPPEKLEVEGMFSELSKTDAETDTASGIFVSSILGQRSGETSTNLQPSTKVRTDGTVRFDRGERDSIILEETDQEETEQAPFTVSSTLKHSLRAKSAKKVAKMLNTTTEHEVDLKFLGDDFSHWLLSLEYMCDVNQEKSFHTSLENVLRASVVIKRLKDVLWVVQTWNIMCSPQHQDFYQASPSSDEEEKDPRSSETLDAGQVVVSSRSSVESHGKPRRNAVMCEPQVNAALNDGINERMQHQLRQNESQIAVAVHYMELLVHNVIYQQQYFQFDDIALVPQKFLGEKSHYRVVHGHNPVNEENDSSALSYNFSAYGNSANDMAASRIESSLSCAATTLGIDGNLTKSGFTGANLADPAVSGYAVRRSVLLAPDRVFVEHFFRFYVEDFRSQLLMYRNAFRAEDDEEEAQKRLEQALEAVVQRQRRGGYKKDLEALPDIVGRLPELPLQKTLPSSNKAECDHDEQDQRKQAFDSLVVGMDGEDDILARYPNDTGEATHHVMSYALRTFFGQHLGDRLSVRHVKSLNVEAKFCEEGIDCRSGYRMRRFVWPVVIKLVDNQWNFGNKPGVMGNVTEREFPFDDLIRKKFWSFEVHDFNSLKREWVQQNYETTLMKMAAQAQEDARAYKEEYNELLKKNQELIRGQRDFEKSSRENLKTLESGINDRKMQYNKELQAKIDLYTNLSSEHAEATERYKQIEEEYHEVQGHLEELTSEFSAIYSKMADYKRVLSEISRYAVLDHDEEDGGLDDHQPGFSSSRNAPPSLSMDRILKGIRNLHERSEKGKQDVAAIEEEQVLLRNLLEELESAEGGDTAGIQMRISQQFRKIEGQLAGYRGLLKQEQEDLRQAIATLTEEKDELMQENAQEQKKLSDENESLLQRMKDLESGATSRAQPGATTGVKLTKDLFKIQHWNRASVVHQSSTLFRSLSSITVNDAAKWRQCGKQHVEGSFDFLAKRVQDLGLEARWSDTRGLDEIGNEVRATARFIKDVKQKAVTEALQSKDSQVGQEEKQEKRLSQYVRLGTSQWSDDIWPESPRSVVTAEKAPRVLSRSGSQFTVVEPQALDGTLDRKSTLTVSKLTALDIPAEGKARRSLLGSLSITKQSVEKILPMEYRNHNTKMPAQNDENMTTRTIVTRTLSSAETKMLEFQPDENLDKSTDNVSKEFLRRDERISKDTIVSPEKRNSKETVLVHELTNQNVRGVDEDELVGGEQAIEHRGEAAQTNEHRGHGPQLVDGDGQQPFIGGDPIEDDSPLDDDTTPRAALPLKVPAPKEGLQPASAGTGLPTTIEDPSTARTGQEIQTARTEEVPHTPRTEEVESARRNGPDEEVKTLSGEETRTVRIEESKATSDLPEMRALPESLCQPEHMPKTAAPSAEDAVPLPESDEEFSYNNDDHQSRSLMLEEGTGWVPPTRSLAAEACAADEGVADRMSGVSQVPDGDRISSFPDYSARASAAEASSARSFRGERISGPNSSFSMDVVHSFRQSLSSRLASMNRVEIGHVVREWQQKLDEQECFYSKGDPVSARLSLEQSRGTVRELYALLRDLDEGDWDRVEAGLASRGL